MPFGVMLSVGHDFRAPIGMPTFLTICPIVGDITVTPSLVDQAVAGSYACSIANDMAPRGVCEEPARTTYSASECVLEHESFHPSQFVRDFFLPELFGAVHELPTIGASNGCSFLQIASELKTHLDSFLLLAHMNAVEVLNSRIGDPVNGTPRRLIYECDAYTATSDCYRRHRDDVCRRIDAQPNPEVCSECR